MDKEVARIYIYTSEYYSAIRKKEITPLAATQRDQQTITLSANNPERQIAQNITYKWEFKI